MPIKRWDTISKLRPYVPVSCRLGDPGPGRPTRATALRALDAACLGRPTFSGEEIWATFMTHIWDTARARGYSLSRFASEVGVTEARLANYLSGRTFPSGITTAKILFVLSLVPTLTPNASTLAPPDSRAHREMEARLIERQKDEAAATQTQTRNPLEGLLDASDHTPHPERPVPAASFDGAGPRPS